MCQTILTLFFFLHQKSCGFQELGCNVEAGVLLPSVLILREKTTVFCDQIQNYYPEKKRRKEKAYCKGHLENVSNFSQQILFL